MAARPLTQLADDLRKYVEEGRAQAGAEVVYTLQYLGPWWTGTFGKSWKLGKAAIQPVAGRTVETPPAPFDFIPRKTPKLPKRPEVLRIPIDSPLYIGNESTYSAFASNTGGTIMRGPNDAITYAKHAERVNYNITTENKIVDWFNQYWATGRIVDDLDKGFGKAS